jgi:thiol-disulfide isomerase/thioredoxin
MGPAEDAMDVRGAWARVRERRWVRWAMDGVLFVALLAGVMAWQTRHLPGGGTPVPPLRLHTLEGSAQRLDALRGKPVVLAVWAPWCGVCKAESSSLSLLQRLVGDSARVVSVATAFDDVEEVRRYVREQEVDYPVLLGGPEVMQALRVNSFPTTFFLSADGRIERAAVGYTTLPGLLWRLWL